MIRSIVRSVMSPTHAKPHISSWNPRSKYQMPGVLALLLVPLLCLELAACGGSSTVTVARQAAPSTAAKAHQRELAELRRIVVCVRRRGFDLPEPDASGRISTQGVNVH